MSRNKVINEAIAEAKAVREAALENAKSMIVDAFTPQLKKSVSKQLDEGVTTEGEDQPAGYDSGHPSQAGEDMLSKGDGDAVYEDDTTVEGEDVAEDQDVVEDVDEDVFEIALGEEEHEDEEEEEEEEEEVMESSSTPSGSVAEQVEAYVKSLEGENKAYKKAVKQLQREFNEVNLFNAKLIYANKVLRTPGLTKDQKYGVVEQFDNAGTISEVKLIFNSLTEGVKIGAAANSKPKARKSSANVKPASANGNIVTEEFNRMQQLSGLLND